MRRTRRNFNIKHRGLYLRIPGFGAGDCSFASPVLEPGTVSVSPRFRRYTEDFVVPLVRLKHTQRSPLSYRIKSGDRDVHDSNNFLT